MRLPISNKTAGFGKRPHIKKGYYPAKFIGYKATKNDGSPLEGKFGTMIILEFAIFKPTESGTPKKPMTVTEGNTTSDVVLDKFVYTQYKNKKDDEMHSSITPNSKPTKIFQALGWKPDFAGEVDIDLDALMGAWVEVLIVDYDETKDQDDKKYTSSSLSDISAYDGEKPSKEVEAKAEEMKKSAEPKKVEKEVKHEDVASDDPLAEKKKQLKQLLDDGHLTENGYNQAIEQLEARK